MKRSFWMQMFQKWMQNRLRMDLWWLWGKRTFLTAMVPVFILHSFLFFFSFHTSELTSEVNFPSPSLPGVFNPRQPTLLPQQSHQEWGRFVKGFLYSPGPHGSPSLHLFQSAFSTSHLFCGSRILSLGQTVLISPSFGVLAVGMFLAELPEAFSSAGRWCPRQPMANPREGEEQGMRWGRDTQMLWIRRYVSQSREDHTFPSLVAVCFLWVSVFPLSPGPTLKTAFLNCIFFLPREHCQWDKSWRFPSSWL